jgi:Holliday junction resolvase
MPAKQKVTDQQIEEAYQRTGSCRGAANELGLCPQSVHERAVRLKINKSVNVITEAERTLLKKEYVKYALLGKLDVLAAKMGRTKPLICREAKNLGLTDKARPRGYSAIWKNMTEEEAQVLWDQFKASPLGLGRFCRVKKFGEIGFWKTMTKYFNDEYEYVIESKTPKTTKYRRGRQFEYRARDHLKKIGFFVLRSPASRSPIDLVAIRNGEVLFVQCKISGALPPGEWNELYDLALSVGALPLLAERDGQRGLLFHRLTGRKDGSRRAQPYEAISIE